MIQVFVVSILLVAVVASGVLGSLFGNPNDSRRLARQRRMTSPGPRPRPSSSRLAASSKNTARATTPRPRSASRPPAARARVRPRPASRPAVDEYLREVRPEETVVPRQQLQQMVARLDRLETALQETSAPVSHAIDGRSVESTLPPPVGANIREQVFILMERGFGVDSVARQLRVSVAEVDLVLRMTALHQRRPEFENRSQNAHPPTSKPATMPPRARQANTAWSDQLPRHRVGDESIPVRSVGAEWGERVTLE